MVLAPPVSNDMLPAMIKTSDSPIRSVTSKLVDLLAGFTSLAPADSKQLIWVAGRSPRPSALCIAHREDNACTAGRWMPQHPPSDHSDPETRATCLAHVCFAAKKSQSPLALSHVFVSCSGSVLRRLRPVQTTPRCHPHLSCPFEGRGQKSKQRELFTARADPHLL